MTTLADRFTAARPRAPLSDLSEVDRRELAGLLDRIESFEDLPGRWQAALLSAEAPVDRPAGRHCCGGH